ncbi:MAG: hypothetical protein ABI591_11015 [Kofleriaceae bacterium]
MARATRVLAVTTAVSIAAAIWMYVQNRELHDRLDHPTAAVVARATAEAAATSKDPWATAMRQGRGGGAREHGPAPALPAIQDESRLERRNRHQQEFAAMFGRQAGETEAEYKARIVPLIKTGLALPRARVEDMRKQAEAAAHITTEQSKQLDATFDKVYDNVLDYTNKAVVDGVLSPYERNVSGWLEYAGGLGTMLGEVNGQIGQVLSPDQMKAMSASGFEWGEYLGLEAPWEQLHPPPAPPAPPKP